MDDVQNPAGAGGLPQGPHFHAGAGVPFTPLRLILQPSGMVLELTQPDMLFGRHSEADVRLPLPDVSRRHCRFQWVNGNWQVVDLKSLNGVFVNEQQVPEAVLRPGDRVRLGGFTFLVDLGPTPDAGQATEMESLAQSLFKNRGSSVQDYLTPNKRAS
jgi:pSer/pThr/pTyr-binding forkhead associated (FHA) protein